ncbi:Holliday junction branch migration protein RuvA [Helicobacter cappadocius]|uniref:Holliday junction branch migration complex subunit RuvA n=1 Tax=Helicobacter cappadocius TaxID=3063998 RepID=A0AA90Q389_9HELI|nr:MULTISPECIES: Holliday junction branch migration protein RuvA [unclassified Helicobacter]MDO7253398.1 Holliday junction branch migration protein RuvA [Helicobacter sp. faydin-H75]MDP2539338.1 Holliday junction branch migration protein RuvA [Helicobacter sp. faydin-H76]
MIVGMIGNIHKLEPTRLEFEVNGLIYGIHISTNTSYALNTQKEKSEKLTLLISQIIREDAHLLFGFIEDIEKVTFERLIKINGVGPKVALAILSTYTPQTFGKIIEEKNIAALQRVPGIGAKGAGKIMVDLAGFWSELTDSHNISANQGSQNEALLALQSLGFKSTDIAKVLKTITSSSTQEIIKEALKLLK